MEENQITPLFKLNSSTSSIDTSLNTRKGRQEVDM